MSDGCEYDAASEHAQTLNVISKFSRAAAALVNPKTMPNVRIAMLALLAEIDDELEKIAPLLQ